MRSRKEIEAAIPDRVTGRGEGTLLRLILEVLLDIRTRLYKSLYKSK